MKIKFFSPIHIEFISENTGETYLINLEVGTCTCKDSTFRGLREAGYKCTHLDQITDLLS